MLLLKTLQNLHSLLIKNEVLCIVHKDPSSEDPCLTLQQSSQPPPLPKAAISLKMISSLCLTQCLLHHTVYNMIYTEEYTHTVYKLSTPLLCIIVFMSRYLLTLCGSPFPTPPLLKYELSEKKDTGIWLTW